MANELTEVQQDDVRDLQAPADNTEPLVEQQPTQAEAPEAPEVIPSHQRSGDEKRAAIADKFSATRRAMDDTALIPSNQMKGMYGDVETPEDRLNPIETQPAKDVQAEDIPAPEKITLKVDGRDVVVDQEQLRAKAQIAIASENVLSDAKAARTEANRILEEIRALRADHSANPPAQPKPAEARAEDTKPATNAELDALIEAIQFGSKEEAAKALSQHGDAIEQRVMQKVGNLDQRVAEAADRREQMLRAQADASKIIEDFVTDNADFKDSEMRQVVLFDETVNVMAEKLVEIGLTPQRLAQYAKDYGLAPQAAVGKAYRELQANPKFASFLPPAKDVLSSAVTRVREGLGLPAPVRQQVVTPAPKPDSSQFVADRIERKQAAQPQPRRASIFPGDSQPPVVSVEQRRQQAAREMRSMRRPGR